MTAVAMSNSSAKNLLLLRLDALALDITKVRAAVERAEQRGQNLREAQETITPHIRELRTVRNTLSSLVHAMDDETAFADLLADASLNLERDLKEAPRLVEAVLAAVHKTVDCLQLAMATTVSLKEPSLALQHSLNQRCGELEKSLNELRSRVPTDGAAATREHWQAYQSLLEDLARPVFVEYVDFLGGLTVRDTGLDDLVCDMTEAVLGRFKPLTSRSLPLPGRQAALGNALGSVVLLGFPEWSIWGIPLVGHEVGLAYSQEQKDHELLKLIDHVSEAHGVSKKLVQDLLADGFATYTLGLSYACAALLLRLNPRHDEPHHSDRPRDIERARVILMTLKAERPSAPEAGGSFTDCVASLETLWKSAVVAHARPQDADAAQQEAEGPIPAEDWLDDLTRDAVEHFGEMMMIRPYDEKRWRGSEDWLKTLREHDSASRPWLPADEVVPDVLTAAWRLRLLSEQEPNDVAAEVQKRWFQARKGV
jgi:hypothetical protein